MATLKLGDLVIAKYHYYYWIKRIGFIVEIWEKERECVLLDISYEKDLKEGHSINAKDGVGKKINVIYGVLLKNCKPYGNYTPTKKTRMGNKAIKAYYNLWPKRALVLTSTTLKIGHF